ncbi:MAG TPA: ATP-binding protein [Gaiellaceae bacterium]|nr:ATP-binding protein [Gaiellaceae bacterium]
MSLRVRLLAAFAYVLILVIVALEVPLVLNVSRRVDAEVKAEAAAGAQLVAASAAAELGSRDARDLTRIADSAAKESGGRVLVVDRQGRVVADSARQTGDYGDRPEIQAALDGGISQGRRFSDTLGESVLFTAVPVVVAGDVGGAVRVTQNVDAIDRRVRRDVLGLIGIGLIALVLGLAFAWFLAGTLARPLQRLAATARRVEAGDLGARAEPEGSRENREVAHAFNDMTGRLEQVLVAQREFVANASHQLRTPLTGLRLRLEAASLKAGPELAAELAAAEREVERLARLLTALLTLAREGDRPPARQAISVAEALERARERWDERAAQGGHRLELECHDPGFAAVSDEDLAIVVDNLVENALVYSPDGGTVTLECGRVGSEVVVAVSDEGPGLEPGEEEQVFERFARGSGGQGSPGTGLGLAIVATLARRWGGSARITNGEAGGARAEARFPAAPGSLQIPNRSLDEALPGRV